MRGTQYFALELFIVFRYEREYVDRRDTDKIARAIKRWLTTGKHTRYTVSYVIVTDETPADLMQRIGPDLDAIGVIEDYECQTVRLDVVGKNGIASPFRSRVMDAYAEIAKRNKPEYMRERRARNSRVANRVEKLDRDTAVKMRLGSTRKRERLPDPDGPHS